MAGDHQLPEFDGTVVEHLADGSHLIALDPGRRDAPGTHVRAHLAGRLRRGGLSSLALHTRVRVAVEPYASDGTHAMGLILRPLTAT